MEKTNNILLKITLIIIFIGLAIGSIFLGKYLSEIYNAKKQITKIQLDVK